MVGTETRGLSHFLAVRDGRRAPRFERARSLSVSREGSPFERHAAGVRLLRAAEAGERLLQTAAGDSLLDLKIELAHAALDSCDLCPHHCRVDRNHGRTGFCGVGSGMAVHWEGILHGEELPLVPSHEVFLSGCTMRCAFCYSHEQITRPMSGRRTDPGELASCVSRRAREGATNLNLVGGEPTVHIPTILEALRRLDCSLPVVWNSNMYATPAAMELLDGVVDLFLGDIHFGNDECARSLGRIPGYIGSLTASFSAAVGSGASVIIRHLVMPGHLDCCARPAMEWARSHFSETPFHLMFQYLPDYRAEGDPVLGRTLTNDEVRRATEMAGEVGVRLYRDDSIGRAPSDFRHPASLVGADGETVEPWAGETVDILIHEDGRVTFTRLIDELLGVASALNPDDGRLAQREGR